MHLRAHPIAPRMEEGSSGTHAVQQSPFGTTNYGRPLPPRVSNASTPPSPATVLDTLVLANRSLLPGNVVPENGSVPEDIAVDSAGHRLFIATQGGVITVVNASSARLIGLIPTGSSVDAVAYDSRDNVLFATHPQNYTISVINATTESVTAKLTLAYEPYRVTYDPSNDQFYVADSNSQFVTVIDGATEKTIASLPVGTTPAYVVLGGWTGDLFVLSWDGTITVINGSTDKVVRSISLTFSAYGLAYDAANSYLYLTECGGGCSQVRSNGTVHVLNSSTGAAVTTIPAGLCPTAIAYDPVNLDLYVVDYNCWPGGNVTVINGTTNTAVRTDPVGVYPWAIAADPSSDKIYVVNSDTNNMSMINGTDQRVEGSVGTGEMPEAMAYDPAGGQLYVANWGGNDVAIVNGTTGAELGTIQSLYAPDGLAFDGANEYLYVANSFSDNVSVFDTTTNRAVTSIPVGSYPQGIAYDPANGDIYVANCNSDNVSVINGTSNTILTTIGAGICPTDIAFDPANGDLYVTNLGPKQETNGLSGNVTVINGSSDQAIASIATGTGPDGVAYDRTSGLVYVACLISGNLTVIDGATDTSVGSMHVGLYPTGIALDSKDNELFVATGRGGNVTNSDEVVAADAGTRVLLGEVGVGTSPWGIVFDESTGDLFVTNWLSGTLSTLVPTIHLPHDYSVTFREGGLRTGTLWSVTLSGTRGLSNASALGFSLTNGTYPYAIANVSGYLLRSASSGTVAVNGTRVTVLVQFAALYPVTFYETGLPLGTPWSVTLNGSTNTSYTSTIEFLETNGTNEVYSLGPVVGYSPTPRAGVLSISGAPVGFEVTFVALSGPFDAHAWANVTFQGGGGNYCIVGTGQVGTRPAWENVSLAAVASNGTPPYRYQWSFGDGGPNATGSPVAHTYHGYGTWGATVTATDASDARTVIPLSVSHFLPPEPVPVCAKNTTTLLGIPPVEGYGLIVAGVLVAAVFAAFIRRRQRRALRRPKPSYPAEWH